ATAGEGGAWGMAVLASYLVSGKGRSLETFLADDVFAAVASTTIVPSDADVAGYRTYLERYEAGLAAERAAVAVLR
ncbi:MAG: ATPase, partial [Propionibacteriaceae bacterium]|nr:ATPase [Propionibacteriaceae bacterium]